MTNAGTKSQPLVSVVIPVFNGLPYLQQTVDSILAQNYPYFELVLVDGGSTDGCIDWIKAQHDPRIRTDFLPLGTPAAITWTRACQLADGVFVKMMGQDDLLTPDALTQQVSALQAHPTAGMATGLRTIIGADGSALFRNRGLKGLRNGLNTGPDVLRATYLAGTNVIGEPFTVLFRKIALDSALPWSDTRPLLLDLDLYTKVLATWDLVAQRRTIGSFRVSATSWSTRMARTQSSQFRAWQAEYSMEHPELPSTSRTHADLGRVRQTLTRRTAYLVLRATRRLHHSE